MPLSGERVCPKCGGRLSVCGCRFSPDERRDMLRPSEPAAYASIGRCGPDVEEQYEQMRSRCLEISSEKIRLMELGFEQRYAAIAYDNQTKDELAAIERDLFKMSRVTGHSMLCRKGSIATAAGLCRECQQMWAGFEKMGGYKAAIAMRVEPGDEKEPYVRGWVAGLDAVPESDCPYSGPDAVEWRTWHGLGSDIRRKCTT